MTGVTMARQRVTGIRPVDHRYARTGDGVRPGALIGVTVRVPRAPEVLIGPSCAEPDGEVTAWQVSRPGGGWVDGVSWPTVEAAVEFARDPQRMRHLVEYVDVRDEAWAARRRAAELDTRAAELLAAIKDGAP